MPGTARFHDKLHRANHHTLSSAGLPDSGYDPIASPEKPFQGDFHLSGSLSASNVGYFNSIQSVSGLTVNGSATMSSTAFTGEVTMQQPLTISSTNTSYINGGVVVGKDVIIAGATSKLASPLLSSLSATIGDGVFTTILATTARITDRLGVGTSNPLRRMHVLGDVLIEGNLSATGESSFQNTDFATSDAINITNNGTTNAVEVRQNGNFGILSLYDGATPAFWVDGNSTRPGYVGIGTIIPNEKLTVVGNVSSNNLLYARGAILTDQGLIVGGTTTIDGQLNITTQRATFSNSIDVYKASNFYDGAVTIHDGVASFRKGAYVLQGAVVDTGGVTVNSGGVTINTDGITIAAGGATINGNTQLINGTVTVGGALTALSTVLVSNTLTVNGSITANNNLNVNGKILSGGVDLIELFAAGSGGDGGGGGGGGVSIDGTLTTGNIELTGAAVAFYSTQTLTAAGDFLLININNRVRKIRLWD